MTLIPKKDRLARTGSNLRSKSSPALDALAPADLNQPLRQLERAFRRTRAKLIKPSDRRAADALICATEAAWQRACLEVDGDSDQRQALKIIARNKLQKTLTRSISGYRTYLALKRQYLKQRHRLVGAIAGAARLRGATLDLRVLPPSLATDVQEFVAPFPRYETQTGDIHGLLTQDDSILLPDTGQLIQNFSFEHNESQWGVTSDVNFVDHLASCGVDFTMPRTGNLQVAAQIENIYNRLNCSITDNFGFSHSYLEAWVDLYIAVVRAGAAAELYRTRLVTSRLRSEGDDVLRSISDLSTDIPYAVGALSLETIPAGEKVTVLAGAYVRVDSDTDDMNAHVRATYWWRLRKLQLGVI
jgi:hypothetical protein